MSKIIERIKEAYHLETDAEVADFLNMKSSTLSMQKNRGRLDLERIIKKCTDLNKNWLLEGDGPMKKSELAAATTQISVYSSVNVAENNEPDFESSTEEGRMMFDISENWRIPFSADHLIGYTIPENLMAPTVKKDDIVFFNTRAKEPDDEAVFLISHEDDIMCRRIQETKNRYIISCDNADQDALEIRKDDNDYKFIGKMVSLFRRID